jgi:DNA-binding IclR family transcriptional regulator
MKRKGARPPTSIEKALDVLLCFGPEEPELGVSQIARRLGLGTSTVHRLLNVMVRRDFVRQNPASSKYSLGFRVVHLAATVVARSAVRAVALPRMISLRDATGASVRLHLISGRERVCIEEVRGTLDDQSVLGHAHPLHSGPSGHVFMADLPDSDVRQIVDDARGSGALTAREASALLADLARIRSAGYATGLHPGGAPSSIAVPIRNFTSATIGALALDGAPQAWSHRHMRSFAGEIMEEAATISTHLGYVRASDSAAARPRRGRAPKARH